VSASITLAAIAFYIACRLLRIQEMDEAIEAIAGRFLRVLRRK
jgi:transcription initiation factor TFIIIB Brf1 subunit/transcription initiation factor TFIIB